MAVMLQRAAIVVVCLAMVALGAGPAYACEVSSPDGIQCVRGAAQVDCICLDQTGNQTTLSSPGAFPCCQLAQPAPQSFVSSPSPEASTQLLAADVSSTLSDSTQSLAPYSTPVVSPPDRQQLLCVLLI